MRKFPFLAAAVPLLLAVCPLSAQAPGLGGPDVGRRPAFDRGGTARLEAIVEELELSEEQSAKWQTTIDKHIEYRETTRRQIADLRQELNTLLESEDPNLERLGKIVLTLHRETRDARPQRQQLISELKQILTPEQVERFDSLIASRQFAQPRPRAMQGKRPAREPDEQ